MYQLEATNKFKKDIQKLKKNKKKFRTRILIVEYIAT